MTAAALVAGLGAVARGAVLASGRGTFRAGIESAIGRMIVDPNFLFRIEHDPAGVKPGAGYELTDLELVTAPAKIGGGSAATTPGGRAMPASSQRSRSARENNHLPVTLVQGICWSATSS